MFSLLVGAKVDYCKLLLILKNSNLDYNSQAPVVFIVP